jgi:hypothetical protein
MTRQNAGNYAGKHPVGTEADQRISIAIRARAKEESITCSQAFQLAKELEVSPKTVGINTDLLDIKIKKCQLGLFGYGDESHRGRVLKPAPVVTTELEKAINQALIDGRLPCNAAWAIADRLGLARMEVASACETLGIKISNCQLGSF